MALLSQSAVFAFVAALCIGVSTIVVKRGLERVASAGAPSPVFAASFVGVAVSFLVFWGVALVRGVPWEAFTPVALAPFLVAGVLYPAVFRFLYYSGVDRVGANVAGAIVAGNPAVAALFSIPLLGERFTTASFLGLSLIVGGGATLQLVQRDADADDDAAGDGEADAADVIHRELAGSSRRDMLYPVGAMGVIAIGYVLIKYGLTSFPHPVTATAVTQTTGVAAFLVVAATSPTIRRQLGVSVSHRLAFGAFVVAGVVVAVGWLGQFFALQTGDVIVVIPLVNTYPLVIAAISYGLARELPRSPRVLAAIVAIVAGASVMQAF